MEFPGLWSHSRGSVVTPQDAHEGPQDGAPEGPRRASRVTSRWSRPSRFHCGGQKSRGLCVADRARKAILPFQGVTDSSDRASAERGRHWETGGALRGWRRRERSRTQGAAP